MDWVNLEESIVKSFTEGSRGVRHVFLISRGLEFSEVDCTVAEAGLAIFSALLWLFHCNAVPGASASEVSSFLISSRLPVLLGVEPRDLLLVDNFLKIILILIEIALSLLISDSLSAVSVSSLVDTPLNVMLLGDLQRISFRFIDLGKSLKIWVSINIALSFFIGKNFVASLISVLINSLFFPVLLSIINVSKANLLDNIRVSVHVALSLSVCHWSGG